FLGGEFDVNKQIGGISGGFGAYANFGLAGKAGLEASYKVDPGTVSAEYKDLTLTQNYVEPTQFGQLVTFTPQNTSGSCGSGSFSTTSPGTSAGLNLVADVQGYVAGGIAAFGHTTEGRKDFGGSLDQSWISYDTDNGLKLFGTSVTQLLG